MAGVGVTYFLISFFIMKKMLKLQHKIIAGLLVVSGYYFMLAFILLFVDDNFALPQVYPNIFAPFLGSLSAFIVICIKKRNRQTVMFLIAILFLASLGFFGMPNWLNYCYTSHDLKKHKFPDSQFLTQSGDTLSSDIFKESIVILDFWSSTCGVCFKQMPELDHLCKNYAEDNDVEVYSVFLPVKNESPADYFDQFAEKHYCFNQLFCMEPSAWRKFKIRSVPEYMILKNDTVYYQGTMNTRWYEFYNNTYGIISRLKVN